MKTKTISIFLLLSFLALQNVLAQDPGENLILLRQVREKLKENMVRPDGPPLYSDVFKAFEERIPEMEKSLDLAPDEFDKMISQEIRKLKMSHLSFHKLQEGTLGLEFTKGQDGVIQVSRVYPHGPADKANIKIGHIVESIDGQDPQTQTGPDFPEESVANLMIKKTPEETATPVKLIRVPKSALIKGKMGITTRDETDGTIYVKTVSKLSAAKMAGLLPGDQILSIDGENPRSRLSKGTTPGETSSFVVKRNDKDVLNLSLTFQSEAAQGTPQFHLLGEGPKKAVYLNIPNFSLFYNPNIIHEAMVEAEKQGLLIVDLRHNGGGRSDHFLSYLLAPDSSLCTQVGMKFSSGQVGLNKLFNLLFVKKTDSSLGKLISIYLSKPRNSSSPAFFLSAYDEGVEKIVDSANSYYGIPTALRILFENRRTVLQHIVEGKSYSCSLPQTQSQSQSQSTGSLSMESELEDWKKETLRQMSDILSAPKIQSRTCKVPSSRTPEGWNSLQNIWGQKPLHDTFPYTGKVAFLVSENTYCSAEACALLPLEYQDLKKAGKIKGQPYKDQLSVKGVKVFGNSTGGAQGSGSATIQLNRGNYQVGFPMYDIYTQVHNARIEGQGISKNSSLDPENVISVSPPKEESEILDPHLFQQIMEWSQ